MVAVNRPLVHTEATCHQVIWFRHSVENLKSRKGRSADDLRFSKEYASIGYQVVAVNVSRSSSANSPYCP